MRKIAHLYSIGPGTRVPSLGLLREPGGVRPPIGEGLKPSTSDVDGCDCIGVAAIVAGHTSKVGLVRSIRPRAMATPWARARGATRVHEHDWNPVPRRLVLDKADQLAEGPGAHHAVETLAGLEPIADAIQPLQDDDGMGVAQGHLDDLCADLVVDVAYPAAFFASGGFDPVGAAVALVATTQVGKVLPLAAGGLAVKVDDAVGCVDTRQSHNTQIDADEGRLRRGAAFTVTDGRRRGYADGEHHIPVVTTLEELGIAVDKEQPVVVLGWDAQREPDVLASFAGRDAEDEAIAGLDELVGVDTQADTLTTVDLGEGGSTEVAGAADTVVGAGEGDGGVDGHTGIVGGEDELLARLAVDDAVELGAAGGVFSVGGVESELDGPAEGVGGGVEPVGFALGWAKCFDNHGFRAVHKYNIAQKFYSVKPNSGASSPRRIRGLPRRKIW